MNVAEIKTKVMFQTNNDVDDLEDYLPYLLDYINEGYDRLVVAWAGAHIDSTLSDFPALSGDEDTPNLPSWTHRALVDWATWCIYRNGNTQKQQRGYQFRAAFSEVEETIRSEGGANGKVCNFFNIPR